MSRARTVFTMLFLLVLAIAAGAFWPSCQGQRSSDQRVAPQVAPQVAQQGNGGQIVDGQPVDKQEEVKPEMPKDGMIYVWPLPNQGHQSLIVLNVLDGNVIDAAYLVPVRVRLKGTIAPGLDEKGGKEARQVVDKLIGGQLRTAQLWGTGKDGIVADFWIASDKEGEHGQWLSAALIKQGVAKEAK